MSGWLRRVRLLGLSSAVLLAAVGCRSAQLTNPFTAIRDYQQLRRANRQCQSQLAQTQARLQALEQDNQELHRLLAREQAEVRRLRAQVAARPSFSTTSTAASNAASTMPWQTQPSRPTLELAARSPLPPAARSQSSGKAFGPATKRPAWKSRTASAASSTAAVTRSASSASIPIVSISGAEVVRDGDVVRIRITSVPLFDPGKAKIRPEARAVLRRIARALKTDYAGYMIGIEGHTDADPIRKSSWGSNHELATERALAVFEYLTKKEGVPASRLFIAGYGPTRPIASNRTAAGKAKNRRVEFVIYPSQ